MGVSKAAKVFTKNSGRPCKPPLNPQHGTKRKEDGGRKHTPKRERAGDQGKSNKPDRTLLGLRKEEKRK